MFGVLVWQARKHGDWQQFIWTGQKSFSRTAGAYLDICWWKIWSQWGWATLRMSWEKAIYIWALSYKMCELKGQNTVNHPPPQLLSGGTESFRGHHPRVKLRGFNIRTVVETSSLASMGFILLHIKRSTVWFTVTAPHSISLAIFYVFDSDSLEALSLCSMRVIPGFKPATFRPTQLYRTKTGSFI